MAGDCSLQKEQPALRENVTEFASRATNLRTAKLERISENRVQNNYFGFD
jgi:hypothetical protein